jgi:hypothetical protein
MRALERQMSALNEGPANRYFEEIEDLEEALVERCQALSEQPELIGSYICYHLWPELAW